MGIITIHIYTRLHCCSIVYPSHTPMLKKKTSYTEQRMHKAMHIHDTPRNILTHWKLKPSTKGTYHAMFHTFTKQQSFLRLPPSGPRPSDVHHVRPWSWQARARPEIVALWRSLATVFPNRSWHDPSRSIFWFSGKMQNPCGAVLAR